MVDKDLLFPGIANLLKYINETNAYHDGSYKVKDEKLCDLARAVTLEWAALEWAALNNN